MGAISSGGLRRGFPNQEGDKERCAKQLVARRYFLIVRRPERPTYPRPILHRLRSSTGLNPLRRQADETIFLVRRSHPETNQCSIPPSGRRAMIELIAAAGVLFSISIFLAHAFDAYRTR